MDNKDPVGFAGGDTNVYAYAMGDPVNFVDPSGLYAGVDDAVFAAGGALVGLGGQLFSDILSGQMSSWQDYSAAFVGGAVAGWTLEYAGPVAAGAAGAFMANLTRQGLNYVSGVQCSFDGASLLKETGIGALTGVVFGSTPKPGITVGRNSYNAIYNQMVTKFENGTISSVRASTAAKMFIGRATDTGAFTGTAGGAAMGVMASGIAPSGNSCGCK